MGDLGDETDARGTLRLLAGEVLLLRGARQVAHAAEQVQLESRKAHGRLVDLDVGTTRAGAAAHARSEEHTSELQSLMRISYAVFCLKKKNINNINTYNQHKLLKQTNQ